MKLVLERRTATALGAAVDVAVLTFIVWIRWRAKEIDVPDPDLPWVSELPQWWWKVGHIGDWLLVPGADAGLWAMNVQQWLDGGMLDLHRPPLYTILTGIAAGPMGDVVFSGHAVNHLLSLLVCFSIYAFGRSTSGRGAAMGAALLTALSAELLISRSEFGVDTTLQFGLMLLALATWWAANGHWWRLIPAGIAGGLAAGGHFISFAFVLPAVLLILLADEPGWRWRRRLLDLVVVLTLAFIVWKLLMVRYPPVSVPGVLVLYGEAVHSYNQDTTPGGGVCTYQTISILASQFWESPPKLAGMVLRRFAHLPIPGPLLIPLCLLGLAGPGLRVWRSPRVQIERKPTRRKWRASGHGWEWRPGLAIRIRRSLGWDWRPCLWLLLFLAPLWVAATANAPDRYTLYCVPLLFLSVTRGIASLAAGVDHLVSRIGYGWPKGILAIGACLGLVGWAWPSAGVDTAQGLSVDVDAGMLQRLVGESVQESFGDGGCLVTFSPEVCYFAGGTACPSSLCPMPGDDGLRQCFRKFMRQAPTCRGDLAYVVEPTKNLGPFLEPSEEMNEVVHQRFEIEDIVERGRHTTLVYRMEREVMEEIAGGGDVWLSPP